MLTKNFLSVIVCLFWFSEPLGAQTDFTLTVPERNSFFGHIVSDAGDINNDGYDDIIVGAPLYAYGRGRAYLYFGGAGMDNIADIIFTGEYAVNVFGYAVSAAGDVNNDGFDDVIIGAQACAHNGRAYIYFGGTAMDTIADIILTGQDWGDNFGNAVSCAGDVNNDGYADVIIGAYLCNNIIPGDRNFGMDSGRLYLYYGGAPMDTVADAVMKGEKGGNNFGTFVSAAGDLNGDHYDDIIIGAPRYELQAGRAYIYFGGANMDSTADLTITGKAQRNHLGNCSAAGDVNNDGFDDVIVGYEPETSWDTVYVLYGGTNMDNVADIVLPGEAGSIFGVAVSNIGDANRDGYSDIVVGAPGADSGVGKILIYFGGDNMDQFPDAIINGEPANKIFFGYSVAGAGDLNNDGFPEIITGTYDSIGAAYVYGLNSVLPVELNSFAASTNDNSIKLEWQTASETNNLGFNIERSEGEKKNWSLIGFIKGKGTTTQLQEYSYLDKNLLPGRYSYRIKQIDYDGTCSYSEAVSASIFADFVLEQNYPNPFNPSTTINFAIPEAVYVTVKIYDILGREVKSLMSEEKEAGRFLVKWNGDNNYGQQVPSGTYLCRVTAGSRHKSYKMMLLK